MTFKRLMMIIKWNWCLFNWYILSVLLIKIYLSICYWTKNLKYKVTLNSVLFLYRISTKCLFPWISLCKKVLCGYYFFLLGSTIFLLGFLSGSYVAIWLDFPCFFEPPWTLIENSASHLYTWNITNDVDLTSFLH
jgi:hypothetical protein